MFEAAELGSVVSKEEYKARVPALRTELLEVQRDLTSQARFPVIVVFAGVDGAGKSETVNLLSEWMDPRWLVTRAFGDPSDEERLSGRNSGVIGRPFHPAAVWDCSSARGIHRRFWIVHIGASRPRSSTSSSAAWRRSRKRWPTMARSS